MKIKNFVVDVQGLTIKKSNSNKNEQLVTNKLSLMNMENLKNSIDELDWTTRTWFKEHVKWIKGIICYVNGDDCVIEDSGEIATRLFVVAETFDKKNPYVIYETYWIDDTIVGHCKSNVSAIISSFNINHVIVPPCNMSRMTKLIYGLLLANNAPIKENREY